MRDIDVRHSLKAGALKEHEAQPDTLVLDELGLEHGQVFVDIAVINGEIHGYEIKSDSDTLERLPHQVLAYSAALDRATLVAGGRHVERVSALIPPWWGLSVAVKGPKSRVVVEQLRPAEVNPAPVALAIAKLLWRDEALSLLERLDEAKGLRSKPRLTLYKKLVEVLPLKALRDEVRSQLKARTRWRADAQRT
ncbi:MAG TPA: sce7726 family protein [Archangium sp.]|nr:sce7726 family protein [Archangium sp.]